MLGHLADAIPCLIHLLIDTSTDLPNLLLDATSSSGEGAPIGASILREAEDASSLLLGVHEVEEFNEAISIVAITQVGSDGFEDFETLLVPSEELQQATCLLYGEGIELGSITDIAELILGEGLTFDASDEFLEVLLLWQGTSVARIILARHGRSIGLDDAPSLLPSAHEVEELDEAISIVAVSEAGGEDA